MQHVQGRMCKTVQRLIMEYVNGTLYKDEDKTVDELPAEAGGSCQEVTGGQ